jgi:hypothetical protein
MNTERRSLLFGLVILSLVAQSILPGCARKREGLDARGLPDAPFAVDTALLGAAQADSLSGLVFRPPADFQPGDPQKVAQIREMVRAETKPGNPLANDPRWVYGIPGKPSMFKIAHFTEPPAGRMNEAWLARVRETMKAQVAPASLAEDRFRVGKKIAVVRFIVRNDSMVLVRALCQAPDHPPAMIDILLPRPDYERLDRAIESTIGALAAL